MDNITTKYSTVFFELQKVHKEAGVPGGVLNTEDTPANRRELDRKSTSNAKDWVEKLENVSYTPLFVYEALQRCNQPQLAGLALKLFEKKIYELTKPGRIIDVRAMLEEIPAPFSEDEIIAYKHALAHYCQNVLPKFENNRFYQISQSVYLLAKIVLFKSPNASPMRPEDARELITKTTQFGLYPQSPLLIAFHMLREDPAILAQLVRTDDALDLATFQWDRLVKGYMSWEELSQHEAPRILRFQEYYPFLFKAFTAKPTHNAFRTLLLLNSKAGVELTSQQPFLNKWTETLLSPLISEDKVEENEERNVLIRSCVKELLGYRNNPEINQFISNYMCNHVSVGMFGKPWDYKIHYDTVQGLLAVLREESINDYYTLGQFQRAASALPSALSILCLHSTLESEQVVTDAKRAFCFYVRTVDTLSQVLMELSPRLTGTSEALKKAWLKLLTIPKTPTNTPKPFGLSMNYLNLDKPGPIYYLIFDRAYATILSCPMQETAHRTEVLEAFLNSFTLEQKGIYPLPLLLVGAIKPEHIPPSDKDHVLARHALQYKGVFQEPISDDLKGRFLTALRAGKFGTEHLEEALTHLK